MTKTGNRRDLERLLEEAEMDVRAGDRGVSVETLRRQLGRPPRTSSKPNVR
jgi:hypothetical protein